MLVIFLTRTGFLQTHLRDLFIDDVRHAHSVELWDLSPYYQRDDQMELRIPVDRSFQTLAEFDKALESLTSPAIIFTNILYYSFRKIYPTIKKHHIPTVAIYKESLFSFLSEHSHYSLQLHNGLKQIVKNIIRRNNWIRIPLNELITRGSMYDYLMASSNFYPEYSRKFVKIHNIKYDEFLMSRTLPSVIDKPYLLFLDTAMTCHPLLNYSEKSKLDQEKYFRLLNQYFDKVEKQTGHPVIIAAHPKSNYTEMTFHGRPIIKYQTPALIEHCSGVLAHSTNSLVQVILGFKPLTVLYYQDMLRKSEKFQQFMTLVGLEIAKQNHAPIADLEDFKPYTDNVDEKAYNQFINQYLINPEQKELSNRDLILQFLDQIEHKKAIK